MSAAEQPLADALQALTNRYALANPPDHDGPEMRAAREALAHHARRTALDGPAISVLDRLLQLAKTDAWNGSFKLDDALQDARVLVAAARDGGDPRLIASTTSATVDISEFRDAVDFWIAEGSKLPESHPSRAPLLQYGARLLLLINGAEPKPEDEEERQRLIRFLVEDWRVGILTGITSQEESDAFLRKGHLGFDRAPLAELRKLADERGYGLDIEDEDADHPEDVGSPRP